MLLTVIAILVILGLLIPEFGKLLIVMAGIGVFLYLILRRISSDD